MGTLKTGVAGLLIAAGGVSPALGQQEAPSVKTFVLRNTTGTPANDLHAEFNQGVAALANEIRNNNGRRRGAFRTTTRRGAPVNNIVDYTVPVENPADPQSPGIMVESDNGARPRVRHQVSITVDSGVRGVTPSFIPGRRPYWTLNGRNVGEAEVVALREDLDRDRNTALCTLDLGPGGDLSAYSVTNLRVWAGLTAEQVRDYGSLAEPSAVRLPDLGLSRGGGPVTVPLGSQGAETFAVIKYDLSYFDRGLGGYASAGEFVYGGAVPTPGALALAGMGMVVGARRRR